MPTIEELRALQAMPLEQKLLITNARIDEWVAKNGGTDSVYISFSGGKDSTVLLHLVRQRYPDIEAVFCDTGLEFPEIKQFVKTFDNVTILRPKMNFRDVIVKYGYPIISKSVSNCIYEVQNGKCKKTSVRYKRFIGEYKRPNGEKSLFNVSKWRDIVKCDFIISDRCCRVMKKSPIHSYERKTNKLSFVGQLAEKSLQRRAVWLKNGCNAFNAASPKSNPLSFWTEQDILKYIKINNIKIASVYGSIEVKNEQICFDGFDVILKQKLHCTGCDRTGCVFCGFGAHLERGETRYQRLHRTHPKLYDYCIHGGEYNDDGIWIPSKSGLGFGHVFDELNKIYGEDFIRY